VLVQGLGRSSPNGILGLPALDDAQALAARGSSRASAHGVGVLDRAEVLDELQPGALNDVAGIGVAQPVAAGDGPYEAAEAVDERAPGGVVAGGGGRTRDARRRSLWMMCCD